MNKKRVATLFIVLLSISPAFSQPITGSEDSEIFAKVYTSYGFLTKSSFQVPPSRSSTTDQTGTFETFSTKKTGMGAGLRAGLGVGKKLNSYINIGIDGEYLMGSNVSSTSSNTRNITRQVTITAGIPPKDYPDNLKSTRSMTLSHKVASVIPNITFISPSIKEYYIYTRVGAIIGIPLEIKVQEENYSNNEIVFPSRSEMPEGYNYFTDTSTRSFYNFNSKIGIGYQASLGVQAMLSERISFFVEVTSHSLILRPRELEQVEHTTIIHQKFSYRPDKYTYDQQRSIEKFDNTGSNDVLVIGSGPTQINYSQSPQITMAVNSFNVGAGIVFHF